MPVPWWPAQRSLESANAERLKAKVDAEKGLKEGSVRRMYMYDEARSQQSNDAGNTCPRSRSRIR